MADDSMAFSRKPDPPLSPLGIGVVAATVLVDQASKMLAERTLAFAQQIDLLPILSLYRVYNTGIAFSLLSNFGEVALLVLTLLVTVFVLVLWRRASDGGRLATIGYALIVGGALGNLIDRFRYGHVVDFLLLHVGERPLFVFNLADVALTLAPVLLIAIYLVPSRRPPMGSR